MSKPISVQVNCGGVRHRIELCPGGRLRLCDHGLRQLLVSECLAHVFPGHFPKCSCRCFKVRDSWREYLKTGDWRVRSQVPRVFHVAAEEALAVKRARAGGE